MRSCRRASELTSASHDRRLTPVEFLSLWIHRALCAPCRVYRRQMRMLRERAGELRDAAPGASLDAAAKERMRERLRAAAADTKAAR